MRNWTIGRRITFGFFVVVVITAAIGIITYARVTRIAHATGTVIDSAMPNIVVLSRIESMVKENFINTTQHVISDDEAKMAAIEKTMNATSEQLTSLYAELEPRLTEPQARELYDGVKAKRTKYRDERNTVLKLSREHKNAEANALLDGQFYQTYVSYTTALRSLIEASRTAAQRESEVASAALATSKAVLLYGTILAIVASAGIAFIIIRTTTRVLRDMAARLGEGSQQLTAAAGQISTSSQSLAQASTEQAAALQQNSASLEEIASMAKRNAEHATHAQTLMAHTRQTAETGASDMQAMNAAMSNITASSGSIAKIIKTIDEIAFQTNILALNAAVEAARAGDAGLGFAVVADEVRSLAQRSAQAARETAASIEESIQRSKEGAELSGKVGANLEQIVASVREVDGVIAEIAQANSEQTRGVDQVLGTLTEMDRVTQSTAASAEETASASEELNAQAVSVDHITDGLQQLVGGQAAVSDRTVAPTFASAKAPALLSPAPAAIAPRSKASNVSAPVRTAASQITHHS